MKIFIKDIPVNIVPHDNLLDEAHYDLVLETSTQKIDHQLLREEVLVKGASEKTVDAFLVQLKKDKPKKLEEITFLVQDYEQVVKHVKSEYTIIKAAGGLVLKDGEVLMIYRLKKWDLPKGKQEPGEKAKECAVREVEEECNIKVKLGKKICSTWHTYKQNGKKILKKTNWYIMYCLDDSEMKPQLEEDIEQIRWMSGRELKQAFYNTYPSIRSVFRRYYQMD